MTFPEVQFVASPDVGAAVRFDFNQAGSWSTDQIWPAHDGVSLGAPTLEGDPDGIGTEYGFRQLSFDLIIVGTHASAATKASALAKELTRQTNWLRVRMTPTSVPVWFKTYKSAPSALNFEHVYASDDVTRNTFGVSIELDADSFAYGARETIGPVTVNNNPAAGTNPVSYALPDIKGDAPTPLAVTVLPAAAVRGVALAAACQIPVGASGDPAPYIWQAEAFSAQTDTTFVADANFSGGSKAVTAFGTTPGMAARIAGQFSPVGSGLGFFPPVGRFTMWVRVGRSDTTSSFQLKAGATAAVASPPTWSPIPGVVVGGTSTSNAWATWVNLGDLSMPPSAAQELPAGVGNGYGNSVALHVGAERLSGTGSLWIDAVMAVPVQIQDTAGTSLLATTHDRLFGFPNNSLSIDGAVDSAVMSKSGSLTIQPPPPLSGSFPVVRPGAGNLFTLLLHCESTAIADNILTLNNDDAIATTSTVTFTYQPRWLYLAAS